MNTLSNITLALAFVYATGNARATDGDLDPSYGNGGMAVSGVPKPYDTQPSRPMLQADGKVLLCDTVVNDGINVDFVVTRLNIDGSPDSSFGVSGKAVIDFDGGNDSCTDLIIQSDGKILVVGETDPDPSIYQGKLAIARLNSNGTYDTAFGSGTGKTTISFSTSANEYAYGGAVGLQSDGKIIAAGGMKTTPQNMHFAVTRLLPDGSFDTTFNSTGKVIVSFDPPVSGNQDEHLTSLLIDSQDRVLVGGFISSDSDGHHHFAVARLLPSGQLDTEFSTDGRVTIDFDLSFRRDSRLFNMALQRDGRIVLVGVADASLAPVGPNNDMAIARLLADGGLDASFGSGGKTLIPFDLTNRGSDVAQAVLIQSDEKILVAGRASFGNTKAAVARMNPDGTLDASFGVLGKRAYEFPSTQGLHYLTGLAMHSGHIYASGCARTSAQDVYDAFVMRIENDLLFTDNFD